MDVFTPANYNNFPVAFRATSYKNLSYLKFRYIDNFRDERSWLLKAWLAVPSSNYLCIQIMYNIIHDVFLVDWFFITFFDKYWFQGSVLVWAKIKNLSIIFLRELINIYIILHFINLSSDTHMTGPPQRMQW